MLITCMQPDDAHAQVRHLPKFVHNFDNTQQSVDVALLCGGKRRVQNLHFYLVQWHLAFFFVLFGTPCEKFSVEMYGLN